MTEKRKEAEIIKRYKIKEDPDPLEYADFVRIRNEIQGLVIQCGARCFNYTQPILTESEIVCIDRCFQKLYTVDQKLKMGFEEGKITQRNTLFANYII